MDRFIVGTGRCGSTLLSTMMAEHPSVLSIFEFFTGLDMTRRFAAENVDGFAFADLLSQEQPFLNMVLKRGYKVEEVTYDFGGPKSRYTRDDAIPWLVTSALPRLSDDPDALFDETIAFARALPSQTMAQHYRALFDWWAQRDGRACWIERSGSSIDYLGALCDLFPDARFVHLHRDGPETALSMREHAAYRLAIMLMFQLPPDAAASPDELRSLDPGAAADASDPISQLLESRPPVEYYGRYWTQELLHGFRSLGRLNADQYLEVSFEDVIVRPKETLRTISEFFELDANADGWIDRAAALVRGVPPTRFDKLPPEDQEKLTEACRVGMQLVGRLP
jgi:hypothetical protein